MVFIHIIGGGWIGEGSDGVGSCTLSLVGPLSCIGDIEEANEMWAHRARFEITKF
jgi:hypothetical protein